MPLLINKSIRYLFTLLLTATLAISSAADEPSINQIKTVVIDPGHGGHDPGTVSAGAKYKEKNIVLSVGLKLGSMIKAKYPHIKVIYTRSTDKFVPLAERSDIANRNKADLFISIHVNATKSTSVNGTETFVMGTHKSESNFELCKAENSVIVMEDDYNAKYEGFNPNSPESYIIFSLLQNTHLEQSLKFAGIVQKNYKSGPIYGNRGVKQGGLIVLWRSTMPAILTEIGFMSNSKDRAVMITKEGQTNIARRLFNAFCEYKKSYEEESGTGIAANVVKEDNTDSRSTSASTQGKSSAPAASSSSSSSPAASASANGYYSIQILSVTKVLKDNAPDLKGRKDFSYIKSKGAYKYMIGRYATRKEATAALPKIRSLFKGAFVIHVKSGKIVQ